MLSGVEPGRVYLACGATDMRKSIDGLAAIVNFGFDLDVFSESWFVFCNRARDKLQDSALDTSGFWLYYRRSRTRPVQVAGIERVRHNLRESPSVAVASDGFSIEERRAHPRF